MEVLICTRSIDLWKELASLTDRFLRRKKARYMSVASNLFANGAALSAAVKKHKAAIVIIDVRSFDNWREIAEMIERLSRSVRICLISDTSEVAVTAINCLEKVCGYICVQMLDQMLKDVFARICGKLRTVCGGITITHYNSVDKVIPFEDIYFIETVKQTHMCAIIHKNGTDEIRADISKLIAELPCEFQIVRSSAIANISKVRACSDGELFFADGSSCFCGKKYESEVVSLMKQPVLI